MTRHIAIRVLVSGGSGRASPPSMLDTGLTSPTTPAAVFTPDAMVADNDSAPTVVSKSSAGYRWVGSGYQQCNSVDFDIFEAYALRSCVPGVFPRFSCQPRVGEQVKKIATQISANHGLPSACNQRVTQSQQRRKITGQRISVQRRHLNNSEYRALVGCNQRSH